MTTLFCETEFMLHKLDEYWPECSKTTLHRWVWGFRYYIVITGTCSCLATFDKTLESEKNPSFFASSVNAPPE